jgi:hypothetical protein
LSRCVMMEEAEEFDEGCMIDEDLSMSRRDEER